MLLGNGCGTICSPGTSRAAMYASAFAICSLPALASLSPVTFVLPSASSSYMTSLQPSLVCILPPLLVMYSAMGFSSRSSGEPFSMRRTEASVLVAKNWKMDNIHLAEICIRSQRHISTCMSSQVEQLLCPIWCQA